MIIVYTAPTTEPVTVAEVMSHARIDQSNTEPAPGAVTVALAGAGAGSVDNGVHRYRATFVTADGETDAGVISAAVTTTSGDGKVALTGIPLGGSMVTSRKLYRTAAGGTTYLLMNTGSSLSNNTATTYTDNLADSSLGAGAPSTNTTSDPLLTIFIKSARAAAEQELHRYLITQTLDAYYDRFPCGKNYIDDHLTRYEFRLPPLQSVTSVSYVDTDGVTQALASNQYLVDAISQPARIAPAYGCSWPSTREQNNAVIIRFIAGYGAASAVPQCVRNWMLMRIKTLWDNRSTLTYDARGMIEIPPAYVDGLLDPERVYGLTS